jgi:HEAT repeat protein
MLEGPDRRSIGRANEAARAILGRQCDCRHAITLLFDDDPLVRMRAADALEKASAQDTRLIGPFRRELVDLLCQTEQPEMRWHLAQMVPRLPLEAALRKRAIVALKRYLDDRSSIVRTWALDSLARIATGNPGLEEEVWDLLQNAERNGTSAMKARARHLIKIHFHAINDQ